MNGEKPRWVIVLEVAMILLGAVATYHLLFVGGRIMGLLILGGPFLLTLGLFLLWRPRSRPGKVRPGIWLLVSGLVMLALSFILVMLAVLARTDELLGMMATASLVFLAAPGLLMVIFGIIRIV